MNNFQRIPVFWSSFGLFGIFHSSDYIIFGKCICFFSSKNLLHVGGGFKCKGSLEVKIVGSCRSHHIPQSYVAGGKYMAIDWLLFRLASQLCATILDRKWLASRSSFHPGLSSGRKMRVCRVDCPSILEVIWAALPGPTITGNRCLWPVYIWQGS